jgi:hypothetical protein
MELIMLNDEKCWIQLNLHHEHPSGAGPAGASPVLCAGAPDDSKRGKTRVQTPVRDARRGT